MSNVDKNVEKKDVAVVSQDVKGELTYWMWMEDSSLI